MKIFILRNIIRNLDELKIAYQKGGIGDASVKRFLTEVINDELTPIRERRSEYAKDLGKVYNILKEGTEKAKKTADALENDVAAKDKQISDYKYDLIAADVKYNASVKEIEELKAEIGKLQKNVVRLETELEASKK